MNNFFKNFILLFALAVFILPSCTKKPEPVPTPPVSTAQTVKDTDGNLYHTVTIGTQVWMVENLKTTKYRDGTPIPNKMDTITWVNNINGAYCDYNNTPANVDIYGRLYNWYAATNSHNICPKGWHVPSDEEWKTLTTYLGDTVVAGGKLKATGTAYWLSPNTGASNETGFSALPGGYHPLNGMFLLQVFGFWWSSTQYDTNSAWCRDMCFNKSNVSKVFNYKYDGMSVRCVKD